MLRGARRDEDEVEDGETASCVLISF